MKGNQVSNILKYWEDTMYLLEQLILLSRRCGISSREISRAATHWKEFRSFLRDCGPDTSLDLSRFSGEKGDPTNFLTASTMRWVATSKRIFYISAEMQRRLSNINLGDICFSDLEFPFPTFGVLFAEPLLSVVDPKEAFSFVMVSDHLKYSMTPENKANFGEKIESTTVVIPWTVAYSEYVPLSDLDKSKLERLVEKGTVRQAMAFHTRLSAKVPGGLSKSNLHAYVGWDLTMPDLIEEWFSRAELPPSEPTVQRQAEASIQAMKIVVNLCLYLQSVPAKYEGAEGTCWQTTPRKGGAVNVATDDVHVCTIARQDIIDSMIRQGAGDQQLDQKQLRSVTTHWRRPHTRRPPGQGSNPLAPKSVKVRLALVCPKVLPGSFTASGAVSIIK